MAMIPKEIVEDIKDRNEIVNLIESYIPLSKKGRNYWGLCPFHLEDTPSFSVSAEKQMYYCFGCHKGGNVVTFLMDYENISFPEAVKKLGERAGISVPEEELTVAQKKYYDRRRRLIAVNQKAIEYFQSQLKQNAEAQQYLQERKISAEMISRFALGYAPDSWEGLKNFLKKQGFKDLELIDAGVVSKGDKGRIFDRFRHRLMFPIFDAKGNAIAFVGRVLAAAETAKYVNTEATSLYQKGKTLYALNLAAPEIRHRGEAILMEGNLDVISAHQFGVTNAIAPQGTALTEDQAKTIWQYGKTIYLAYDSDNAGQKAALKNMDILIKQGFRVYVMELPQGMDPDDVFQQHGLALWQQLKAESLSYMSYKIKTALAKYPLHSAEGKADAVRELEPSLLAIKNKVERSEYIRQIAEQLEIDENLLHMDMQRRGTKQHGDLGRDLALKLPQDQGLVAAKQYIFRCALENQKVFDEIESHEGWDFLDKPAHIAIIELVKEHYQEYGWSFRHLADFADESLKAEILPLAVDDSLLMTSDNEAMFRDSRKRLQKERLEKELKELSQQLKAQQESADLEEEKRLLRKFDKIQKELRELS